MLDEYYVLLAQQNPIHGARQSPYDYRIQLEQGKTDPLNRTATAAENSQYSWMACLSFVGQTSGKSGSIMSGERDEVEHFDARSSVPSPRYDQNQDEDAQDVLLYLRSKLNHSEE